jgi:hypothetical protein
VKSIPAIALSTAPPALLGFRAGESPYKVKGHVYEGLFESTEKRCPGGVAAVLPRLADPGLQTFFRQRFLAASTYDLLPLLEFGREASHLAGVPYATYVRGGARMKAEKDVHGLYRTMLRLATPGLVVGRLPRVMMQYMTFGVAAGRMLDDKTYEILVRGVPEPVRAWLTAAAEGFIPLVLETAGAKNVVMRPVRATPDEDSAGTVSPAGTGVPLVMGGVIAKWE